MCLALPIQHLEDFHPSDCAHAGHTKNKVPGHLAGNFTIIPSPAKTRQVHTAKGRSPGFRIKTCLLHLSPFPFPFPLRLGNSGFGCSSPVTVAGPRRNYTCLPYSPLKTAPLATILFALLYWFLPPVASTTVIIFFDPERLPRIIISEKTKDKDKEG